MGFASRHPLIICFLVFMGFGVVAAYWPVFVAAGVIAALGYGLYLFTLRYDRNTLTKAQHRRLLAAHADFEHHCLMAGDPRGVYGQYRPYC